jgi:hypothetical protein
MAFGVFSLAGHIGSRHHIQSMALPPVGGQGNIPQTGGENMTRAEITDWLLQHGFSPDGEGKLTARHLEGIVSIEFLERRVRSTWTSRGETSTLSSTYTNRIEFDVPSDTLHGIALYTPFDVAVYQGGPPPVWYSPQLVAAMRRPVEYAFPGTRH